MLVARLHGLVEGGDTEKSARSSWAIGGMCKVIVGNSWHVQGWRKQGCEATSGDRKRPRRAVGDEVERAVEERNSLEVVREGSSAAKAFSGSGSGISLFDMCHRLVMPTMLGMLTT